ncbi:DUF2194 domain-containing protein [Peribacillus acanthi]|uniref:DUF2194 domain-containing protein n=1 Tax=Peribacillus acanthi TaxID=2171554 RepID=UPI000D3E7426|nr:DUF2194 domain-containing protein [Peribacillus acanthi]
MKNHKFRIGKSIYLIVFFIFIFGVFLEITQTDLILKTYQNNSSNQVVKEVTPITLPPQILKGKEQVPFLILYDENNIDSVGIKENFKQTLHYMKQKVELLSVHSLPQNYDSYQMVILTFEDIGKIQNFDKLDSYVSNGGKLFFAIRPGLESATYKIYRKLGIFELGNFTEEYGIQLTSNILINQKGLSIKGKLISNSSLAVGLDSECTIYAKSITNDQPLLWDVPYDKGKIMVFNGTMLSTKDNRGMIAGAISVLADDFIYPIMNMKLVYLDDFPAPVPQGYNEKIYQELKLDIPTFYRNVWWPFIQKQSAKHELTYTGVVIETYNNQVSPPFSSEHEDSKDLVKYGRELLKMGGEIGIHGYNHQSLVINQDRVSQFGYKAWPTQDNMESSLKMVQTHINRAFPNYDISTYVPPSNVIDQTGIEALKNTLPSIKNISSIYLPDADNTAYIQEYEEKDGFVHLPRITSGHHFNPEAKWVIANAITSIGVFSHFIHPDDILDENRANLSNWDDISDGLNRLFKDVNQRYSWLKSMTAKEGTLSLKQYELAKVLIEDQGDKKIGYIDQFSGELSFILRTNKKIGVTKGCKVEKISNGIYYVIANKEIFEVELR